MSMYTLYFLLYVLVSFNMNVKGGELGNTPFSSQKPTGSSKFFSHFSIPFSARFSALRSHMVNAGHKAYTKLHEGLKKHYEPQEKVHNFLEKKIHSFMEGDVIKNLEECIQEHQENIASLGYVSNLFLFCYAIRCSSNNFSLGLYTAGFGLQLAGLKAFKIVCKNDYLQEQLQIKIPDLQEQIESRKNRTFDQEKGFFVNYVEGIPLDYIDRKTGIKHFYYRVRENCLTRDGLKNLIKGLNEFCPLPLGGNNVLHGVSQDACQRYKDMIRDIKVPVSDESKVIMGEIIFNLIHGEDYFSKVHELEEKQKLLENLQKSLPYGKISCFLLGGSILAGLAGLIANADIARYV